jgi:hypothetical protein
VSILRVIVGALPTCYRRYLPIPNRIRLLAAAQLASTNNAYFPTGAIAPGLRLIAAQTLFASKNRDYFPTISIMNNAEGDPITLTFPANRVTALAFDYFGIFFENGLSQITLYDNADNQLWTVSVAPTGTGIFVGFLSDTPIDRVVLSNGIALTRLTIRSRR